MTANQFPPPDVTKTIGAKHGDGRATFASISASGIVESARLVDGAPAFAWRVPPPALALLVVYYGSLLGVFILAILTKRATARGAFWGMVAGVAVVLFVAFQLPWVEFLWHNVIGAVVVVVVGLLISVIASRPGR